MRVVSALAFAVLVAFCRPAFGAEEQATESVPASEAEDRPADVPAAGTFTPGAGFLVGSSEFGELRISLYMVARYLNQLPAEQSFVDHLGREHEIDTRNDIFLHRAMIYLSGWAYARKLRYMAFIWTVNATTQVAVAGNLNYEFGKAFTLFAGIGSLPGTRTMTYVFPYFFGTDRQMADEFFRPSFTGGVWASGEPVKGLKYHAMLGDNLSILGINANQLTRSFATSVAVWVMPTTGEFGPRGGFGDYEMHEEVATILGAGYTHSDENRFSQPELTAPDNTQIRLSDSLLLFEEGNLAPGVTVSDVDYQLAVVNGGLKYSGFSLHAEYYFRWLTNLRADGPLPIDELFDHGFYVQSGYQLLPQRLEFYGATSWLFGEFNDAHEWTLGTNVYPADTRNWRLNGHFIYVDRSPTSSLFGYYVGGQKGPTLSLAVDILF